MDCRRNLLLAVTVFFGGLGCYPNSSLPVNPTPDDTLAFKTKDFDYSKRKPKTSTLVSMGSINEESAADPKCTPAQQEQYHDRARKFYQQALELDANDLPALLALARLYSKIDDHEHAVSTYQRAAKSHPKDATVWYELGMCQARSKELDPAAASLRQAVALDPENRLYTHSLGFCLARAGHFEESFSVFAKLEGEAVAHYNLARMLLHLNEYDYARQQVQLALQAKPDLPGAQRLLDLLESPNPAAAKSMADYVEDRTK